MEKMMEYFKTDRNGTKYYYDYTCSRCGGVGGSSMWAYTGYTCYECGGTGRKPKPSIVKRYTEEYAEKLNARREAKYAKIFAEQEAERKAKEEAERAQKEREEAERKAREEAEIAQKAISQYCYEVGDKVDGDFIFLYSASFEVPSFGGYGFQTMFVHNFKDSNGNKFVWKTSCGLGKLIDDNRGIWKIPGEGESVHVKGKVKDHMEYKGEKQTALERCKITF